VLNSSSFFMKAIASVFLFSGLAVSSALATPFSGKRIAFECTSTGPSHGLYALDGKASGHVEVTAHPPRAKGSMSWITAPAMMHIQYKVIDPTGGTGSQSKGMERLEALFQSFPQNVNPDLDGVAINEPTYRVFFGSDNVNGPQIQLYLTEEGVGKLYYAASGRNYLGSSYMVCSLIDF